MIKNILQKIWLKTNEIDVYLKCLYYWSINIKKLLEETKIARTQIYPIVNSLVEKWLISELIWNNSKTYIAEDISVLKKHLIAEKQSIEAHLNIIDWSREDLEKLVNIDNNKIKIRYYENKEWVDQIYNIAFKKDFDCFSDLWRVNKFFPGSFIWIWSIEKLKWKKNRNILTNNAVWKWWFEETKNLDWIETKLLTLWQEITVDMILWEDHIAYISFTWGVLSWTVINNPDIYHSAKLQFELLWDKL